MNALRKQGFMMMLVSLGLVAVAVTPAEALLPAVEGQIQLLVDTPSLTAFGGVSRDATFLIPFKAVSADGSVFPQDGRAESAVMDFFLQIGDTFWNETMTDTPPLIFGLQFANGKVTGLSGAITPYNPNHPDFLWFPTGRWSAIDIEDRGEVAGTYNLDNLSVVPIPGTLVFLGFGLLVLGSFRLARS
jgi:hypothetical protein